MYAPAVNSLKAFDVLITDSYLLNNWGSLMMREESGSPSRMSFISERLKGVLYLGYRSLANPEKE